MEVFNDEADHSENVTIIHSIAIVDALEIDHVEETTREIVFNIGDEAFAKVNNAEVLLRVQMFTNIDKGLPLLFAYDPSPINKDVSVICAAVVLLGLYVLIIWDVVHRTFAAIIASTLALSVLAILHQKPSMEEVISWIDVETLLLLFGMMILVAILSETGIFNFLAVYAYKVKIYVMSSSANCTFCLNLDNKRTSMATDQLFGLIHSYFVSVSGQCYNHPSYDTRYDTVV